MLIRVPYTEILAFKVIDFYSGCGGTSAGLRAAGMEIILGIDFDVDAEATFCKNFQKAKFIRQDIRKIKLKEIAPFTKVGRGNKLVFCGCAPCQPFTKLNTAKKRNDERVDLLSEFGRFVKRFKPHYVVVENVPGIQSPKDEGPLGKFKCLLQALDYSFKVQVVSCHLFGVPQTRKRLVLIAVREDQEVPWPAETHGEGKAHPKFSTVWEWINDLPPIKAGEEHPTILNHRAAALSPKNLKRIKATRRERGRECWPENLKLECHKDHKGHSDVYGRLRKQQPSAALTTRCISLSNGRFGHPEQHRAISVREAACLQTFDRGFEFCGSLNSMARQIGNAVPVLLAKQIGLAIIEHGSRGAESK